MSKVISSDGTEIAFETKGAGKTVILVDGAICYRGFGPMQGLSELLAPHFKVITYDRRGRGESSNSKLFAIDREIEDIEALMAETGGEAYVYGISSGACLSLEAALKSVIGIKKLAIYEPPYNADTNAVQAWKDYRRQLHELIAANRRGDAVALFMQFVGTPTEQVNGMRQSPMWKMFEAVAPTLEYDAAETGEERVPPVSRAANLKIPTLIMDGGANMTFLPAMHDTAVRLAKAIPHAQQRTLEGQTHDVDAKVLAPVLVEFFNA